jgi:hypothetical protein
MTGFGLTVVIQRPPSIDNHLTIAVSFNPNGTAEIYEKIPKIIVSY